MLGYKAGIGDLFEVIAEDLSSLFKIFQIRDCDLLRTKLDFPYFCWLLVRELSCTYIQCESKIGVYEHSVSYYSLIQKRKPAYPPDARFQDIGQAGFI